MGTFALIPPMPAALRAYVLAVGHAHHASIDHTLAPLGNAKH
jgi:hypothetical protein